jgi:fluoride exporter
MINMRSLLFVGIGGGIGSMVRYLISLFVGRNIPVVFPLGTFLVNCSGCFLIGLFYAYASKYSWFGEEWRLFFITGICGGYTTFSTFSYDGFYLLKSGSYFTFLVYALGTMVLGLLATFAGAALLK